MNNNNIEIILSIKFLAVLLNKNLLWKDQIKHTENKVSRSIGIILYKARDYLSKQSLLSLHCACIHTYVNYCNSALASTIRRNL